MAKLKFYQLSILNNEFISIVHEMDEVLHKASRSSQLNVGKDFSSGITLGSGGEYTIEEGDPTHLAALSLVPNAIFRLVGKDKIKPGDCYLTNSPHTGGTHHADFTLAVPVFYENELMFWAINRAHQSDVGAPLPTTYPAGAIDIFQEGLHFPVMAIQTDYENRVDLIRMIKLKNRVPERFYGDYLAQVGALRSAEAKIQALIKDFGMETIKEFISQWVDLSEKRMVEQIKKLPKGDVRADVKHDPIWDVAPLGVDVRARVIIDPEEAMITVDFTENKMENLPFGFNISEATMKAAAYWGVFSNLEYVPKNVGSYKRIKIKYNEGTVIGKPNRTASTSVATTNLVGRLFSAVAMAFTGLGKPFGMAEGANGMLANWAVISGEDQRKNLQRYAAQIFLGAGGGPGISGYDGWVTYGTPDSGGAMRFDSVELLERNFPLLVQKIAIRKDSIGAGEYDGAPGLEVIFGPKDSDMAIGYYGDCRENIPKGVIGGKDGAKAEIFKINEKGERVELPLISDYEIILKGEKVVSLTPGGGGYGSPSNREPDKVFKKVRDEWISFDFAENNYGVVRENN
jgi:N-methylhydantoinase B/oxoprolinase/acetone carboxylase alpha subunit